MHHSKLDLTGDFTVIPNDHFYLQHRQQAGLQPRCVSTYHINTSEFIFPFSLKLLSNRRWEESTSRLHCNVLSSGSLKSMDKWMTNVKMLFTFDYVDPFDIPQGAFRIIFFSNFFSACILLCECPSSMPHLSRFFFLIFFFQFHVAFWPLW